MNTAQPENEWKNPSAACVPQYLPTKPVPAIRTTLAKMANGIVAATSTIRFQVSFWAK